MPQWSKIGVILFLSCLKLRNSVILSDTLTFLIMFEQLVLQLLFSISVFQVTRIP